MNVVISPRARPAGFTLLTAIVFFAVLMLVLATTLRLSAHRVRMEHNRFNSMQAFFHAENALNWTCQKMADATTGGSTAPFLGQYAVADGTLGLAYQTGLQGGEDPLFVNTWVTVQNHPTGVDNLYRVTASAKVGHRTRTLQASVRKNPSSLIFDYEYFLNNWGWWWGSSITGNGDNRANWDFDFRDNPVVNGSVLANGHIASAGVPVDPFGSTPPFQGLARTDPISYVKTGVPRLEMPNLLDFSYYQQLAVGKGGTLHLGSDLVVAAVHTNTLQPGLYLQGTAAQPIRINGPVVIPGDVVLKGVVTGTGTFYVGGNLYLAGDVTYLNGPSFATPPALLSESARDAWVQSALDNQRDLIAFGVRESIFGGAVNSSEWVNRCYNPAAYGLKNVGDESLLGEDGIAHTPDDGIPFLDTNGDGTADSAWYDSDGDGVVDRKYIHATDIVMNAQRAGQISHYPTNSVGLPEDYNTLSSNDMNRLDGIFYCNHAVAMRLQKSNTIINGVLVCRDEAIVFNSSLKFNYDARVHSRYTADPNRYVDLGLPVGLRVRIEQFAEIAPCEGFFTGTL